MRSIFESTTVVQSLEMNSVNIDYYKDKYKSLREIQNNQQWFPTKKKYF